MTLFGEQKDYPKNEDEWRIAIYKGLGITQTEGKELFQSKRFPVRKLEDWIRIEHARGFGPEFVPALLRNIKGLVAWVYGDGPEPCWPGKDPE